MEITLPADLSPKLQQELASGLYKSTDELIEQAVRHFLDERQRGQRRQEALSSIGDAVDSAGLYERTLPPDQQ